jgi:hypothetical protein
MAILRMSSVDSYFDRNTKFPLLFSKMFMNWLIIGDSVRMVKVKLFTYRAVTRGMRSLGQVSLCWALYFSCSFNSGMPSCYGVKRRTWIFRALGSYHVLEQRGKTGGPGVTSGPRPLVTMPAKLFVIYCKLLQACSFPLFRRIKKKQFLSHLLLYVRVDVSWQKLS